MPKVSVIITTFQRYEFLIRAINSVLNSDYSDFEIVVIDDNGQNTDFQKNIELLLAAFTTRNNVKYFTQLINSGACKARNKGAELASGEILMFLDDDDFYLPNKISRQVKMLENSNFDACLCAMKRINEENEEIISVENFPRGEDLKSFILNGNCYTLMIAIKKESFMKIGGFSEIPRFQDQLFMYNFYANNLKSIILNEQLFVVLEHKENRISNANLDKISTAFSILFDFEKSYFYLFSNLEKEKIKSRNNLNQALIRTNSNLSERFIGLIYLIKSKSLLKNFKVFIKLIFSDKIINSLIPKK